MKEAIKIVTSMEKLKIHQLFSVTLNTGTKGLQSKQKKRRLFCAVG